MSFWGELYVRSTEPFLTEERTTREVGYLGWAFGTLGVPGPVADLGCGTGRHTARVAALTRRFVFGFERDAYSVQKMRPNVCAVRADLLALPLAEGSLAGAYAWYSTLFNFEKEETLLILRALRPALKDGALLVLHTVPLSLRLKSPEEVFECGLPEGVHLSDVAQFDVAGGRDQIQRTLTLPDGRVLSGGFVLRVYSEEELRDLLDLAGYTVRWVHGGTDRSPLNDDSTDLIVGAEVRHG